MRIIVDGVDHHIHVAVIVKITEGAAARSGRGHDGGTRLLRDVIETAVAQILVQQFLLRVAGFGLELFDFGIHVAVANQNVGPAVIVGVEKSAAPAEELRVTSKAALKGGVFEHATADVVIERGGVAGKIRFYDVEISIEIVVGRGNAHAGLRFAVCAWPRASRYLR